MTASVPCRPVPDKLKKMSPPGGMDWTYVVMFSLPDSARINQRPIHGNLSDRAHGTDAHL